MSVDVEGYELGSKSVQEEETVAFLTSEKGFSNQNNDGLPKLLTREDLIRIDKEEPIWRRLRTGFMVMFWLIWFSLLTATILLVVFSAKCPNKPDLPFYKSKIGYWVDPHAFKDSDGNGVGDFKGLIDKLGYIKEVLNAGYLILDSVFTDCENKQDKYLSPSKDWTFDSELAADNIVPVLLKKARREGIELIVSVDFNSLPVKSWLDQNVKEASARPRQNTVSRLGTPTGSSLSGAYSIYGAESNLFDLNLENPLVLEKVQQRVNDLLRQGFSGVLLKDAAFFTEGPSSFEHPIKVAENATTNPWFKKYQSELMFAKSSVEVIHAIREAVNNASAATGQEKVLIVDAGNTGWGLPLTPDPSEMFVGNETLAHMIIGRHFVGNRGWKARTQDPQAMRPSLENYLKATGTKEARQCTFLCTASPQDAPKASAYRTALSLLLPGPALIYYGSELSLDYSTRPVQALQGVYPEKKQAYAFQADQLDKAAIAAHFPMVWDASGAGFSHNSSQVQAAFRDFLALYAVDKTAELGLAEGHPKDQILDLVRNLTSLRRSEPSLQWGDDLQLIQQYTGVAGLEVFRRWGGYGQQPIVVALLTSEFAKTGQVLNLELADCEEAEVLYTFPESPLLKVGPKRLAGSVYLEKLHRGENGVDASLYLFKCKAVL